MQIIQSNRDIVCGEKYVAVLNAALFYINTEEQNPTQIQDVECLQIYISRPVQIKPIAYYQHRYHKRQDALMCEFAAHHASL